MPGISKVCAFLLLVIFIAAHSSYARASEDQYQFDIAEQELGAALDALVKVTGARLIYPENLAHSRGLTPVKGTYTLREALDVLLENSTFSGGLTKSGVIVVSLAKSAKAQDLEESMPNTRLKKSLLASVAAFLFGAPTGVANAQDASVEENTDELFEEILILGDRKESVVSIFGDVPERQLPVAIRMVGAQEIKDRGLVNLNEIMINDPSWLAATGSEGAWNGVVNGALRGFFASKYMSNGMPLGYGWSITAPETIERVEVMRGAAAFSYGFMPPGGAINIVTKSPADEPYTFAKVSVDSYGNTNGHVDISRRFADDKLGIRVIGGYGGGEIYTGGDSERAFINVNMDYRISPDTLLTLFFEHVDAATEGGFGGADVVFIDGTDQLLEGVSATNFPVQDWEHYDVENTFFGAKITHDFSENVSFVAVVQDASYHENFRESYWTNIREGGIVSQNYYNGFWDFQDTNGSALLSVETSFLGMEHNFTVGGQYSHRVGSYPYGSDGFYPFIEDYDIFNPISFPIPDRFTLGFGSKEGIDTTDEYGAFLSDVISVTDRLRLMIGVRWSQIDVSYLDVAFDDVYFEDSDNTFTPLAGFMFDVTETFSIYGNYTSGIQPGGQAPIDALNPREQMPVLTSTQYELGFKWDASKGLRVDGAVFHIDQPSEYYNGPGTLYTQDGSQVHKGFELLVTGAVSPIFSVSGGIQYMDAKLEESADPLDDGSRAIGVPEFQGTVSATLEIPAVEGLSVNANLLHVGERHLSFPSFGEGNRMVDAFTTLDMGVNYSFEAGGLPMTARVHVRNLTNEHYAAGQGYGYGAPRSATFSIEAEF